MTKCLSISYKKHNLYFWVQFSKTSLTNPKYQTWISATQARQVYLWQTEDTAPLVVRPCNYFFHTPFKPALFYVVNWIILIDYPKAEPGKLGSNEFWKALSEVSHKVALGNSWLGFWGCHGWGFLVRVTKPLNLGPSDLASTLPYSLQNHWKLLNLLWTPCHSHLKLTDICQPQTERHSVLQTEGTYYMESSTLLIFKQKYHKKERKKRKQKITFWTLEEWKNHNRFTRFCEQALHLSRRGDKVFWKLDNQQLSR